MRRSLIFFFLCAPALAQKAHQQPEQEEDLGSMNIEDLMNIKVTSVSRTEAKLSRTAAAVFVINREDIQRSGATNIPDVLRMVPGLDVAQIDAHTWAISARGLNDEFSDELLVLLDGRNVYTPTFGGVLWDLLDLPLENIERIEVIRGPGGSVWGTNAVNGVINIITKKAGDTRGAMVVSGGGNLDHGFATAQFGGSLGKSTDYRIYSRYFNQDHLATINGPSGVDGWHLLRGGFRADSTLSSKDTLMFQGDLFTGRESDTVTILPSVTSSGYVIVQTQSGQSGGFLQSVWNHTFSPRSDTKLEASYGVYQSDNILNDLREGRKTFSIDFQHHFAWGARQDFVWGLGYRDSASASIANLTVSLNPPNLNTQLFSGFVQDEIAIVPGRFYLTVGTKLEHNYYTGFIVMPSVRVTYSKSEHQMLWAALSRAAESPSSVYTDIRINYGSSPGPGGTPILTSLLGNPQSKNEGLIAYEMGYRATVSKRLSIDLDAYYNDFSNQQTTEPAPGFLETTPSPAHFVMPYTFGYLMYGEAHGLEIGCNWKLTDRWTISPGYDFERFHMHLSPASQDTETVPDTEGSDPHMHAQLRSHFDLSKTLAWDTSAYFVDRVIFLGVPAYTRLDTGLSWRYGEGLSLSLVGQNLVRDHHLEFVESRDVPKLVKRGGYAKVTWRF